MRLNFRNKKMYTNLNLSTLAAIATQQVVVPLILLPSAQQQQTQKGYFSNSQIVSTPKNLFLIPCLNIKIANGLEIVRRVHVRHIGSYRILNNVGEGHHFNPDPKTKNVQPRSSIVHKDDDLTHRQKMFSPGALQYTGMITWPTDMKCSNKELYSTQG